ncbi:hypothetical protein O0L34_g148 [Tuta absoluta]|nr:hypothetical protein O0L34_g148 [Tuta absoluta]
MAPIRTPPKGSKPDLNKSLSSSDPLLHNKNSEKDPSRGYKRTFEDVTTDTILTEISKRFDSFEDKQTAKFDSMNKTLKNILEQNQGIQKCIQFLSDQYDLLTANQEKCELENLALKQRVMTLENKIDLMERNNRASMIELKNIPKIESEKKSDLCEIIQNLGKIVKQPVQITEIKDIYRIKSKTSDDTIVVNFTSTDMKENIIKSTKVFNKENKNAKLNSVHLNIPGPSKPIYVAESLTTKGQHLYYLARKLAKTENFDSCWTSYGKIYVKKSANLPSTRINTEEDLAKLKTYLI